MLDGVHKTTPAGNAKPLPPEQYLEWVLEACYDGAMKDSVINSFKAYGIGAIGGADDHLNHRLYDGNGIPNGSYKLTKAREAAEAQDLAEDNTGHVSDADVIDNEAAVWQSE
ncbi:hypothetical protein AAVH_36931 [Aphelenchoides avenae]|nr:hypothetical protein AAVH_36931 [Aphelenchus avenae]